MSDEHHGEAQERMASSPQGKSESHLRLVSDEEAVVIPDDARPTDDTPTVISKAPPVADSNQDKIIDLSRKPTTPESILSALRGKKLAHFELLAPIGVGGMAAVIRARDTQLDRFVALKILPPEMAQETENVQRFHQEAKSAAKLDHANIARVFFCGEDQGLHFIAFEFVEGINLRDLMVQRNRLSVPEAIRYGLQIAAGLEHATSRGVVHRDVKPSNIIITPHGQAKLVDMGLARNLERQGERDLTQSGMTLGTFDYISPEQALEPREADARSDIYSLGCTLYHLLTGQPPVPEGTPLKKLDHHRHQQPIDPRQLNPAIPDEVVMILGKMMAKNPKDRYQRPIHLVQHLMQVARQVGAADDVPEGVLFVDTPLPGQPQTRPVLMIGLALAALVAIVLLFSFAPGPNVVTGFVYNGGDPKPPAKPNGGGPDVRPTPNQVQPVPTIIENRADLENVFAGHAAAEIKVPLGEDKIELKTEGITYIGGDQKVIVESPDNDHRTITFKYKNKGSQFAIALDGGRDVVFRRIKFVIESEFTPERAAAAVGIRGAQSVTFEQCIFVQKDVGKISVAEKKVPLASVLIEASDLVKPNVYLKDCYFDHGGQVAIAINGPARVTATNCAFRPHNAFFSFRDKCTLNDTVLLVEKSSGFVETGPAFRFSKNASAQVDARGNAFLRPGGGLDGSPGLIFLAGDQAIQYRGTQNFYYNLNSLLQREKEKQVIEKFADFKDYLEQRNAGSDTGSVAPVLADNPLVHSDPLGIKDDPRAFQLASGYKEYGIQKTWLGTEMPKAPVPIAAKNVKKIIDPDAAPKAGVVFNKVDDALRAAKDGDVIWIRYGDNPANRQLVVSQADFQAIGVTLKPFDEKYHPILVLDQKLRELEASLIKLKANAGLTLENLEVVLDPEKDFPGRRSVAQLGEGSVLTLDRCLITFRSTNKVELCVATLPDLDRMMKMEGPAPAPPRVEFRECFVRGKGDLVALQGCRKLDVAVTKTLVALDGSLLDLDALGKAGKEDQVHWTMDQSSIFTTESLFTLRTKSNMVLTKTNAKIDKCVLASLEPGQPIVSLRMDSAERMDMLDAKFLNWECDQNYYANFDKIKLDDWKGQFPLEQNSKYGMLTLSRKLTEMPRLPLWEATPDLFRPTEVDQDKLINGLGIPPASEQRWMPATPTDEP